MIIHRMLICENAGRTRTGTANRNAATPANANAARNSAAQQPKSGFSRFLGPIAGIAVGVGAAVLAICLVVARVLVMRRRGSLRFPSLELPKSGKYEGELLQYTIRPRAHFFSLSWVVTTIEAYLTLQRSLT